ncbi:MAG TPA: GH25 family lysozyme [Acidimicrobiales bacterium]|nr:GH25 family lysozyme [Acidimicrobiales bacterium]
MSPPKGKGVLDMSLFGVDIDYTRESFDFGSFAGQGHRFAWIKATEGRTWPDHDEPGLVPVFARMRQRMADAGLVYRGMYHFARPDNNPDPATEAAHFVSYLGGRLEPGEAVMLDWEPPHVGLVQKPDASEDWIIGWVDAVEAAFPNVRGKIGFYANASEVARISTDRIVTRCRLHVAAYGPNDGQAHPDALGLTSFPGPVDRWDAPTFWQFTSAARLDFFGLDLDMNRFEGDEQALVSLAADGPSGPVVTPTPDPVPDPVVTPGELTPTQAAIQIDDWRWEDARAFQEAFAWFDIAVDGDIGTQTAKAVAKVMAEQGRLSPHFHMEEFRSKHNGRIRVNRELILALERAREKLGSPISITSGYRDPDHPLSRNTPNSQHVFGCAVDPDPYLPPEVVEGCGFSGIGMSRVLDPGKVSHLDVRHASPNNTTGATPDSPSVFDDN